MKPLAAQKMDSFVLLTALLEPPQAAGHSVAAFHVIGGEAAMAPFLSLMTMFCRLTVETTVFLPSSGATTRHALVSLCPCYRARTSGQDAHAAGPRKLPVSASGRKAAPGGHHHCSDPVDPLQPHGLSNANTLGIAACMQTADRMSDHSTCCTGRLQGHIHL